MLSQRCTLMKASMSLSSYESESVKEVLASGNKVSQIYSKRKKTYSFN
jgi:hypothetical protein